MAKALTVSRMTELVPTAIGGTLGVFGGMVTDDAVHAMLQDKSESVLVWTSFAVKVLVAAGVITMSTNEGKGLKDGGLAAGSAMLGTAVYGLLSSLAIISGQ